MQYRNGPAEIVFGKVMSNNKSVLPSNIAYSLPKYGIFVNVQISGNFGHGIDFPQQENYDERKLTNTTGAL